MAVLTVVGAGMMGSALCVPLVDRGHQVRLVGTHSDREIIASLRARRVHPKLGVELPAAISTHFADELEQAVSGAELLLLGVSSGGLDWAIDRLRPFARPDLPVAMITKGLRWSGADIDVFPDVVARGLGASAGPVMAIGGPCIAGELARRVESCVVVAGRHAAALASTAALLRADYYHVFTSTDVIGVEVCAALKNGYAMGCAFAAGIHQRRGGQPGSVAMHNHESAVLAQAAFEMLRIVLVCGGETATAIGLAGVGDLDVTNNGGRTGTFGRLLGTGLTPAQAIEQMTGATLECLEILRVMRNATGAWRASGKLHEPLPLLDHLCEVALDGAPVAVPFDAFFPVTAMARDLVVGIDASTTACKAVAWDGEGRAVAEGRAAIALHNPAPDGWEQDAEDWWTALGAATRALVGQVDGARLGAVCMTNQRETFVVTDSEGKPLHRALVWMDKRCTRQVEEAVARLGRDVLHRISGKPPCTTPSIYKLLWLLDAVPSLRAARGVVLDVHAFLAWRMTGRRATSLASADPTGLVDMAARGWSAEIAALAGLTELPELVEPGAVLGAIGEEAARHTGLPAGLPLCAGAGDGQCAGLGAGIVGPGRAYLNLGTAIVSGVLATEYRADPAFRTLFGAIPGTYFLETDLQGGTFTLGWLVEKLLGETRPVDVVLGELAAEAASIAPGSDGLVVVPYWNGVMNPYWDDEASGVVVGWRGSHGPAHLYRAVLEGIAFEQRLHTTGVEQAAGAIHELVVMGGGSKSDLWCQILADALGKRVVRAGTAEATALGAGILAAVPGGLHPDLGRACAAMTRTERGFEPGPARDSYDRLYHEVYEGLYPAVQQRMQRLWRLRTSR